MTQKWLHSVGLRRPASLAFRFSLLSFVLAGIARPAWAQSTTTAPPTVEIGEAVTVMVWNRPLVVLRASVGEVTPQQRAERIRALIESLPAEKVGEVRADHGTLGGLQGILLTVDGQVILGLLPQDVNPESTETLDEVGREAERSLTEILRARAEQQQFTLMLRRLGLGLSATLLLSLFLVLVLRLRKRVLRLQTRWMKRPLAIQGFDLRSFLVRVVTGVVNGAAVVLILAAVQSWLAFTLTQFPYTRPWGEGLRSYLVDLAGNLALGALHAVPGLFTATLILFAARFVSRGVALFFQKVERGELHPGGLEADTARATRRLAIALVWIFAIIAAYPYLPGSETEAFRGMSVFVGLMVSLGGVSFVNQVMSGLVVVYARTFKVGDYVSMGTTEGVVTEIGALSTKIVTRTREEITVPNAVLVGTTVTNYTRLAGEDGSVVKATVTIGYDTPWRQVHSLLELAAERTKGVRKEPKPAVLQRSLSDFYVEYQLLAHIEKVDERIRVLSDLHASIQDAFNENDVQIMSPHYRDQPPEKVLVPKERWDAPLVVPEGAPPGVDR